MPTGQNTQPVLEAYCPAAQLVVPEELQVEAPASDVVSVEQALHTRAFIVLVNILAGQTEQAIYIYYYITLKAYMNGSDDIYFILLHIKIWVNICIIDIFDTVPPLRLIFVRLIL